MVCHDSINFENYLPIHEGDLEEPCETDTTGIHTTNNMEFASKDEKLKMIKRRSRSSP